MNSGLKREMRNSGGSRACQAEMVTEVLKLYVIAVPEEALEIALCDHPPAIVRIAECDIPQRSRVHECWCRAESESGDKVANDLR